MYQNELVALLGRHFECVIKEWSVSRNAADSLAPSKNLYAPRIDVAVGPFNVEPGNRRSEIAAEFDRRSPPQLTDALASFDKNPNPRCALAIEVSFSGSSKHVLGDITNASMMGLYGVVVANDKMIGMARRILSYLTRLGDLNKGSSTASQFRNVTVIGNRDFSSLFCD